MTAHPCAGCGMSKQAAVHSRHNPDGHVFVDPRPSQQQKQRTAERERELRWRPARERQVAEEPSCQLAGVLPEPEKRCWGTVEVHHVLLRSQGGKDDGSTPLMTLCSKHHSWAHENRDEAAKQGARV